MDTSGGYKVIHMMYIVWLWASRFC